MLDRLEVTKSLTANMEGDGIGGAVNLIMKDAPSERQFTVNLSTGYNAMYFRPRFSIVQSRSNRKTITLRTNGQARRQPGNNG